MTTDSFRNDNKKLCETVDGQYLVTPSHFNRICGNALGLLQTVCSFIHINIDILDLKVVVVLLHSVFYNKSQILQIGFHSYKIVIAYQCVSVWCQKHDLIFHKSKKKNI